MASKRLVPVRILDQKFMINTDASPEYAQKIAEFVGDHLEKALVKTKNASPYNAALLAALNIAESYFAALEAQDEFKGKVAEKSKKILGLLDSAGKPS